MSNKNIPQLLEINAIFINLLIPEILLAHLDINNNEWITYDSNWFYKIDKKDISLPFQRNLYITNDMKNRLFSYNQAPQLNDIHSSQNNLNAKKIEVVEKTIREILDLNSSTPIESWVENSTERTIVEDMIASNHIKILSIESL